VPEAEIEYLFLVSRFGLTVSRIGPVFLREVVGESNLHLIHEGVVLFLGAGDLESAETLRQDLNQEWRYESGNTGLCIQYLCSLRDTTRI
jgi:hypothetical protein